jgi:hypothetical protein
MRCLGPASLIHEISCKLFRPGSRRAFFDKEFSNIGAQKPMDCRPPVGLQMNESCAGVAETTFWTLNPQEAHATPGRW